MFGALVERLDRAHQRVEWERTGTPSASLEQMIVNPESPSRGPVDTAQPDIAGLAERAATIVSERFPNVGLHDVNSLVLHELNSRREEITGIEIRERRMPQNMYPFLPPRSYSRFQDVTEVQRSTIPWQQDISQPPTFVEGGTKVGSLKYNAKKTPRFQDVRKCPCTSKLLLFNVR